MIRHAIKPAFVEHVPDRMDESVLYISRRYAIAVHLCCCGCRGEVVTPLSPAAWRLFVEGDRVSLYPSVGNWGLVCRSHYWIRNNSVVWAPTISHRQAALVRHRDQRDLARHVETANSRKTPLARREQPRGLRKFLQQLLRNLKGS